MRTPYRITKNGSFWDLVTAKNQQEALSISLTGQVNDLPEDFARKYQNKTLTAWIQSHTYQVKPAY